MDPTKIWLIVGFIGQGFFSARFLVQWIVSEARRKSVIPLAFWFFSLGGGATLLAYAIYREDPVFIVGQAGWLGDLFAEPLPYIPRAQRRGFSG